MAKNCRDSLLPPIQNPTPTPQRGFVLYFLIPFLQALKSNLSCQPTSIHNGLGTVSWQIHAPSWSAVEDRLHISQAEQTAYDFAIIFAAIWQGLHCKCIGESMVSNLNFELLRRVEAWKGVSVHGRIWWSVGRVEEKLA